MFVELLLSLTTSLFSDPSEGQFSAHRDDFSTVLRVEPTPAGARSYAWIILPSDWRSDWECLDKLWWHESRWNRRAYNESSGAGGIPQILGMNPKTSLRVQLVKGFRYIRHRYDTPCAAWDHFTIRNWY